ncbi:hypothetical protein BEP19_08115 [Ammoniphilus oxalaticus]|uniref:Uncharacterized protein YyaB-like PH domain-containing protein n=1 Tax=Ammoniphilus oxalaticus TaxID=66863 RepID=A0A419SK74_9BACL|nr:PH domain-containing protein [Ammoniphilus oxalaticus]RKD24350.1 hypothetical protein BEP19_08115 [Ammoniphilus oxalaticus]
MYFPSKKDVWLAFVLWGSNVFCVIPLIIEWNLYVFLIVMPIVGFICWIWFSTGYTIDGDQLIVQSGPIKKSVDIKSIRKIRETKNPLSAPALSLDRLEIIYGRFGDLALVSPQDKQRFIELLQNIQPQIEVELKKK